MRSRAAGSAGLLAALLGTSATAEPAIGQFELKNLESERGPLELQSQNAWSWGEPRRKVVGDDEDGFEVDENSIERQRHALEIEFGLSERIKMRLGIEFEKERIDDPATLAEANAFEDLDLTEIGAEVIAVLVPREDDGAGLGVVVEYERSTDDAESAVLNAGPIIEWQRGAWSAAAVPMLVYFFGGDAEDGGRPDDKWDFAYASQLMYRFSERWALALEGYGTVERIGNSGNRSESAQIFGDFNQHRLGPVVYYTLPLGAGDEDDEGPSLDVGLGFLAGLNSDTPDETLKLSIEYDF